MKLVQPKKKRPLTVAQHIRRQERMLEDLEFLIDLERQRGNWLTATDEQRRNLIFDAQYHHALEIFRNVPEMTMQDAVAFLKAKPPCLETIATLTCLAPIVSRSEQGNAAQKLRKGLRESRYASEHAAWMKAAPEGTPNGTKSSRQRAAVEAIKETGTRASRRTIAAFVKENWHEISSASSRADRRNLSV